MYKRLFGVEKYKEERKEYLKIWKKKTKETKYFLTFLAKELGVEVQDILDFELCLYCMEEPGYIGINDTMISSPRLDNLTSVSALLSAIVGGERTDGVNLFRTFSDKGLQIRKVGTDEIYDEAVDVEGTSFRYEETDIPIEPITEA